MSGGSSPAAFQMHVFPALSCMRVWFHKASCRVACTAATRPGGALGCAKLSPARLMPFKSGAFAFQKAMLVLRQFCRKPIAQRFLPFYHGKSCSYWTAWHSSRLATSCEHVMGGILQPRMPNGRRQRGKHRQIWQMEAAMQFACAWLAAVPAELATALKPQAMQVALRRRLRLALPLGPNRCGPSRGCGGAGTPAKNAQPMCRHRRPDRNLGTTGPSKFIRKLVNILAEGVSHRSGPSQHPSLSCFQARGLQWWLPMRAV